MTPDELTELVDLYVADDLPDALRGYVEARLAASPEAARDAATLRAAVDQLRSASAERPDSWFTERLLDTLLREHTADSALTRLA